MLQTVDVDANLVGEVTLVCGSFFCFSSAAEMAMASAVDLDATTDADANILNTV